MQRKKFLTTSATLMGALPFVHFNQFNIFNTTSMNDEIVTIKIGQLTCTIFRDLMFKYLAKDFFINAGKEDLDQALNKYHLTPDNIPSPFIGVLIQHDDKKIFIDTGIGFLEEPLIFRGNSYVFKGRLQQLLQREI